MAPIHETAWLRSTKSATTRQNAEVIVASTHGRRGFQRLRLGSFVESLMISSKVPVLVVNQNTRVPKTVSTIFFPTDFSGGSRKALQSLIKLATKFKARVIIYHFMQTPNHYGAYDFYGGGPNPQLIAMGLQQAEKDCKRSGQKTIKVLRKLGIECEFILDKRSSDLQKVWQK